MALSTGPLDKSQHCPQHPTRGDINLVLSGWHLQRMDVNSFSLVDPWERTFFFPSIILHSWTFVFIAGSGKSVFWCVVPLRILPG